MKIILTPFTREKNLFSNSKEGIIKKRKRVTLLTISSAFSLLMPFFGKVEGKGLSSENT